MSFAFALMFVSSLFDNMLSANKTVYLLYLIYSVISAISFFIMRKDLLVAQFWIYLSTSLLLFGCFLTLANSEHPAINFIVMLLITPMFVLDRPIFMGLELAAASAVYLIWMHDVKAPQIWKMDLVNVIMFSLTAFLIHVISNSIRIREFVLMREINIQKDTDETTGLKNKSAVTREINHYLADSKNDKGILLILDIDQFKSINDTYGHDIGDSVIKQLGSFLDNSFTEDEVVGRFGGDEFIIFIRGSDDAAMAERIALDIVTGVPEHITLPDATKKVSASIGIALYHGDEQNYSELFKKADATLYEIKSERAGYFKIWSSNLPR